jgi:hypothetical protein
MNLVTRSLEELIEIHTNDLAIKEPAKTRRICNMFIEKSIGINNNDILGKKPVEKILVKPIPTQTNDVLVNLVIGVNLLECFSPKSHIIFQEPPTLTLWLQYKKLVRLFLCLFIFTFKLLVLHIILR